MTNDPKWSGKQVGGNHYSRFPAQCQPIALSLLYKLPAPAAFALKHLLRFQYKGEAMDDLKKAIHYLEIMAEEVERGSFPVCSVTVNGEKAVPPSTGQVTELLRDCLPIVEKHADEYRSKASAQLAAAISVIVEPPQEGEKIQMEPAPPETAYPISGHLSEMKGSWRLSLEWNMCQRERGHIISEFGDFAYRIFPLASGRKELRVMLKSVKDSAEHFTFATQREACEAAEVHAAAVSQKKWSSCRLPKFVNNHWIDRFSLMATETVPPVEKKKAVRKETGKPAVEDPKASDTQYNRPVNDRLIFVWDACGQLGYQIPWAQWKAAGVYPYGHHVHSLRHHPFVCLIVGPNPELNSNPTVSLDDHIKAGGVDWCGVFDALVALAYEYDKAIPLGAKAPTEK
jgi:hypothetical protein